MGRKVGSILSFLLIALEIVSAIFLTPFIVRKFGQAEYGVYTLVLSITSYLTLLDLGIGNSVVKFVSSYRAKKQFDELRKFEGIITVFYFAIAFVALLIGLLIVVFFPVFFSKGLNSSEIVLAQKLLFITTLNVSITLGTSGFLYTIVGYERFFVSKGLAILFLFVRIVISFICLLLGGKSLSIVVVNATVTFITRFVMIVYVLGFMKIKPTLKNIEKKQIKAVLLFSSFIFLQMLATQINSMADSILIGALVTNASLILAIYGVGATLKSYFSMLGGAFNNVLMPGVVKMVEKGASSKEIENEMIRIGRIIFAFVGMVFFCFCVFGEQFIELWAGKSYHSSYYVALILMLAYLITLTQSVGTQFLWATNQHKEQSILKIFIVVSNIAITILLMQWNSLFGAVIGTFISIMLGDVLIMQLLFKKKLNIRLQSYYTGIAKGIIPSLIIASVISFFVKLCCFDGWLGLIINCSLFVCIYIVCMISFGFSNSEKKYLVNALKIRKRHKNV